jgi:hypothetical protein
MPEVQRNASLVAVEGFEVERMLADLERGDMARHVATHGGVLDLDDVRSKIGELHGAPRAGPELLDGQDAEVGKRRSTRRWRGRNRFQ